VGLNAGAVIAWLLENAGVDEDEVTADTLLFSTSLVDSFDMVDLVAWIEAEAGVQFGPLDINLDNLDSVERIVAFVASRSS